MLTPIVLELPSNCLLMLLWLVSLCMFCFQQQRRQLTDCAFQWAELQEILLGEESDLHDNRVFVDERNRRTERRQVKLTFGFVPNSRNESVVLSLTFIEPWHFSVNHHKSKSPVQFSTSNCWSNDGMPNIMSMSNNLSSIANYTVSDGHFHV